MYPNYIFVGPRKTGTTTIYKAILQSNDMYASPDVKEIFYFDKFFDKGPDWYKSFYSAAPKTKKIMECSPGYFHNQDVALRIKQLIPDTKIIITLRNPVDRAISDYFHYLRYGHVSEPFSCLPSVKKEEILLPSRYLKHVKMWMEFFGRENVLLLFLEDFETANEIYSDSLYNFTGCRFNFDLKSKENVGGTIGNPRIAKFFTNLTFYTKKLKLNFLINIASKVGLKKIIYQSKKINQEEYFTPKDRQYIEDILREEITQYEFRNY